MTAAQTVYLRKKNEELLNVLEENARHLNRKVEICSGLLRGRPRYRKEEFTDSRDKSREMSPIAKFNQRGRKQTKIVYSPRPRRSNSAARIRGTSLERGRSPRRGHSTCIPSQPIRPASRCSSGDNRWSKLQQDLASYAHMHGYTLSHALSKCYCTRNEGSDTVASFMGGSQNGPESFARKTRIPPRLKEKRHQTYSPKRRSCGVKWAEPNTTGPPHLPEDLCHLPDDDFDRENNQKSSFFCGSSVGPGDPTVGKRCGAAEKTNTEIDSDWFMKMKNFRKSNWSDCHAPDRQNNEKPDCKCNRLYMVDDRLFLEPLSSYSLNNNCCCSKKQENNSTLVQPDAVVTLPKIHSGVDEKPVRSKKENTATARLPGKYRMNGPCVLTGHKTRKDDEKHRAMVLQRPSDSFALRYQKGVDPRKP